MRGLAHHRGIVTVGDDQSRSIGQIPLLLEDSREVRRHRPEEAVAIVEIIRPLAVADKIRLGDLDLDDREASLAVNRHQVGAPPVRQRHLADGEQVLPAE